MKSRLCAGSTPLLAASMRGRCKAPWKNAFMVPWREAGPLKQVTTRLCAGTTPLLAASLRGDGATYANSVLRHPSECGECESAGQDETPETTVHKGYLVFYDDAEQCETCSPMRNVFARTTPLLAVSMRGDAASAHDLFHRLATSLRHVKSHICVRAVRSSECARCWRWLFGKKRPVSLKPQLCQGPRRCWPRACAGTPRQSAICCLAARLSTIFLCIFLHA